MNYHTHVNREISYTKQTYDVNNTSNRSKEIIHHVSMKESYQNKE